MKKLSSVLVAGAMALALGGLVTPAASAPAAPTAPTASAVPGASAAVGIMRVWHATVQCQIVRISDNNAIRYDRADGTGNTEKAAIDDAARNIPVPAGHYKRHCDAKRTW
ncbi:hypothetical protein OHA98_37370 [Streptomyces sp. NBC_00654]|uniref:hypothetical protein n=1 Tax=Streptomyces sp. NBC_00654 TaxID=2975799 RepID=UPI00225C3DA8|nr:hypothetical protein [Streptomyces sp. NBC_00654]MCX4970336.1 hypothetical protein [Streptomyces sp. NBC_00654]